MNDIFIDEIVITEKSAGTLFGKYQRLLGDKERAGRAHDAAIDEVRFNEKNFEFIRNTYHVIQDRLLESIVRLSRWSRQAKNDSREYYASGDNRLGRHFANLSQRLKSEMGELNAIRIRMRTEMATAEREYEKSRDDMDTAFRASVTADNKYYEYCRNISNRLEEVLNQ